MKDEIYHRAFGVYGIYYRQERGLLVISKTSGPYVNRLDLPGGSMAEGEGLDDTLRREFLEETGMQLINYQQLGVTSFRYPWPFETFTMNNHIAVFNLVQQVHGNVAEKVREFPGQDSKGARFLKLADITPENSSPLVLKAKKFIQNNEFDFADTILQEWQVL
ncbi:NUDIX hydrolase [Weissella sp. MSCH1]|uniref:NUDIX hydrolase n=1 Tax=Weissella sp. MSCH1 TaxID=3383343 RepID=UPI0038968708